MWFIPLSQSITHTRNHNGLPHLLFCHGLQANQETNLSGDQALGKALPLPQRNRRLRNPLSLEKLLFLPTVGFLVLPRHVFIYAKLLSSVSNRDEEARDAARVCLRMPLPRTGLTVDGFRKVAILGSITDPADSDEEFFAKLQSMFYEKMPHLENYDSQSSGSSAMTPERMPRDEANNLLGATALTSARQSTVRPKLAEI